MATPKSRPRDGRPGRLLALMAVLIVGMAAIMIGFNYKSPKLGIDLAGGTSITLTATSKDPKAVNPTNMNTAAGIINQRVNAFGVSEATVQVQGSNHIVVDIPKSENSKDAADQVGKTAKLYFRPVLAYAPSGVTASTSPSTSASPGSSSSGKASASPSAAASGTKAKSGSSPSPAASGTTAGRALSQGLEAGSASAKPSGSASPAKASGAPSAAATPSAAASADASAALTNGTVPADLQAAFAKLDCSKKADRVDHQTSPTANAVACGQDDTTKTWYKFALAPVAVDGVDVSSASAYFDTQQGSGWTVQLKFNGKGSKAFASTTGKLATQSSPQNEFAIVLDGDVVSHPYVSTSITGGSAVITGSFSQTQAQNLADILSFGALPLTFEQSDVTQVSATLGSDQLKAGLIAGIIGLALVVVYSLFYYRALGLVTVASLLVAGAVSYESMVLLGPLMGFTLSLPGIAGAIVAVGVTADSFIVFFERIRDELREGRTLRPAVQHAWGRARRTILTSDFVSFLAAAVLYVVSIGAVKGFAFTLGLTTLIDVVVVFLFTKPLVTLLARRPFFAQGRPWSGLDPNRLGVKKSRTVLGRRARATGPAAAKEA